MRTTAIRTKYSMGSGIVLIAEASEAILGGEGRVYVARTLNSLLLKRILVGKVEEAQHLCLIETANLLGQVPASEDVLFLQAVQAPSRCAYFNLH